MYVEMRKTKCKEDNSKVIALTLRDGLYEDVQNHAQSIGLSVTNTIRLLCKQALKVKESEK